MGKINLKQKFLLIVFSIIIVLISIEIILRLAGIVHLYIQDYNNRISFESKNLYKIMCIGESTTFLGGKDSYPNQLQEILDNSRIDKTFKVINKGVPGIDSGYISRNLNLWLTEYKPQIVVGMIGINDPHQLTPLREMTPPLEKFQTFIKDFRVYKLFKWLTISFKSKMNTNSDNQKSSNNTLMNTKKTEEKTPKSLRLKVLDKIKESPKGIRELYSLSILYEIKGDYKNDAEILKKLIKFTDDKEMQKFFYKKLGKALIKQEKYKDLVKLIEFKLGKKAKDPEAIDWIPHLPFDNHELIKEFIVFLGKMTKTKENVLPYYDYLEYCYLKIGNMEKSFLYSKKAQEIRSHHFSPYTQGNYKKIIKILYDKGIKIILVQYPLRSILEIKNLLTDKELSNVYLVDNEGSFRDALAAEDYDDYFTDRFAGNFGHCTPRGNKLIAQNISKIILNNVIKE